MENIDQTISLKYFLYMGDAMLYKKLIREIFATSVYCYEGKMVIGYENDMPWKGLAPSGLKRFRDLTSFQSVIMGHNTWKSWGSKPLPDRQNIIISRNSDAVIVEGISEYDLHHCRRVVVVDSFEKAVLATISKEVWVMGGEDIFALALPYTDYIHQTMIDVRVKGDTFFPGGILDKDWKKIHEKFWNPGEAETPKDKARTWYFVFERK